MQKFGIDVSSHQGNFNFAQAKTEGVEFVIIRASWGTNRDTKVDQYVKECERLNIPYGFYCYSYALNDNQAVEEAKFILNIAKQYNPTYPIFFDMEDADGYKKKNGVDYYSTKSFCDKFCQEIEKAGYYASIYASKSWLDTYLKGLDRYDKWVAQWYERCTYTGAYGVWQFTSDKIVAGQRIDCNYCYKDYPSIIKNNGLNGFTATKKESNTNTPVTPKKSVEDVAKEVVEGKWGNGEERKTRLRTAGYSYTTVQTRVNELMDGNKKDTSITYTIKLGDNLSKIAKKYNTTWQKIYEDNKSVIGSNPNIIKPGKKIIIK